MTFKAFILCGLMSLVVGSAIEARTGTCRKQKPRTIDFDNVESNLLEMVVPVLNRVGTKADPDVDFGSFVLANSNLTVVPAVAVVSPPNAAVLGIARSLTDKLLLGSIGLQPSSTIKPAGKAKYFDLNSAYFGCALNLQNAAASVSRACQVSVTGINHLGESISSEDLVFGPESLVDAPMTFKEFEGFDKMESVTVTLATGTTLDVITVIRLDDVSVTPYYCDK